MPALVEYRPDGSARQSWSLEKDASVVIGRNPDQATIVIPHVSVSRKHAVLKLLSSRRWRVADLGAVNGTYVDDALIRTDVEGDVDGGEVFRFGENGYEYKIEAVPPVTSKSGSDDDGTKRGYHGATSSVRKPRQVGRYDDFSVSSGSASPTRFPDGRREGVRDRARDRVRPSGRERGPSRDREFRGKEGRGDSEDKYRERDRDRRREKEKKRGRSRSRSRSRSKDRKGKRRSKWDETKPKSLFSNQPSAEELEKQKALLVQLASLQQQRRRPVSTATITPSCILEPPPGVTPKDDSKPKLSVQEKRKLLWGKKDGGAASVDAEAPGTSMQTADAGTPSVPSSADPNNYATSFKSDREKQSKFLKLLGYKGEVTSQEDPKVTDSNKSKDCFDEDEIKRRETDLESQYMSSVLRSDGRKAGLGM